MDWIVSSLPSSLYVKTIAPDVIIFEDRNFTKAIKVKWGYKGANEHIGKTIWVHSNKVTGRKRLHNKPIFLALWYCTFNLQNCEKISVFKAPSLFYFVTAAWAD